ncbi:hypothetical protein A5893_15295 [Pedobacter psychrophilus]|uniref:DUF4157 domain-containing protein n=1 Tax=Pedobacter psychrophilus TaxID=1826909 RepID=A0A179DBK4_9SPHI|nr:hypothetical protein A5893_15295 [Pedobacter psychrophilus]
MKPIDFFENIRIFESKFIKNGHGITLPNFGIFLSPETFSLQKDLWLVKHEFGHILQYRELGFIKFYLKIGIPSLISAIKQNLKKDYYHQKHNVEIDANRRSYLYFDKPKDWPFNRFPIN